MSVTLRFQSTGTVPGSGQPVTMVGPSLTIGRGQDNDLVLPDPERVLSKRHCVIEDVGGNVQVIDLSTNGTFLNYAKTALGQVPTPLHDGDVLILGTYELVVQIHAAAAAASLAEPAPPLAAAGVSPGVAAQAPTVESLLDAPEPGGDFLDDLLGSDTPGGPGKVQRPDLGEDGLLPPLGEDEGDLLTPAPDPFEGQGASDPTHNPGVQDNFASPATEAPQMIPDDWDDDLLGAPEQPAPSDPTPFAPSPPTPAAHPLGRPEEAPAAQSIDNTDFDAFLDDPEPVDIFASGQAEESERDEVPGDTLPSEDQPAPPEPEAVTPEQTAPAVPVAPADTAPSRRATSSGGDDAARAFLAALGAQDLDISDAELTGTMERLGHMTRTMVEGVREVLMTRSSIKGEFRINQTMIAAGGNNPLKFSVSPEQCMEALVRPRMRGYVDAPAAAREALDDIRAHEIAMVTGMEAALRGVLARLDPGELAGKIETSGGLGSILKGKKARYWEIYEKMYAEISDQAENEFHDLFAREFSRAYQDQLDRLK